MRSIRFIFKTILILTFLATIFLWIHTWQTPDFLGLSMDWRGHYGGEDYFAGRDSFGLYAAGSQIGFLRHTDTCHMFEKDTLSQALHEPARFLNEHSDDPDDEGFMRGISLYPGFVKFYGPGVAIYSGDEFATGHEATLQGFMLSDWIIFVPGIVIFVMMYRRRRRRQFNRCLCSKCGYDIGAQLLGQGGDVCPECGTPIAPVTRVEGG